MELPKLRYVAGVSWPRSGHHLLESLLGLYFGPRFRYCEFYIPEDCCKQVPCARAGVVTFSKNHDFDFDVPIVEGVPYLIQYRDFLPSVVSDFELFVRGGGEDSAARFEAFARNQAERYNRFMSKWVWGDLRPTDRLTLAYEALVSDPIAAMNRVIAFFSASEPIDQDRLAECCRSAPKLSVALGEARLLEKHGVQDTRDIKAFRYYDEALFARLGQLVTSGPPTVA